MFSYYRMCSLTTECVLVRLQEACAIVPKVVYHMETYEPELLRSAIPNYFLAEIAASEVKMVLTGEGADELFAGYRIAIYTTSSIYMPYTLHNQST